jgi:environmental stress-induced protein Ves
LRVKIIRKDELKTNEWSGGTTTQLCIYPYDAQYSQKNFKWRISSAKVEVEESTFTHLPGINRKIMILDGELQLEHEGHHSVKLNQFEQDNFYGGWITKSYGKVTDFNLMMNKDCIGNLEYIFINECSSKEIKFQNKELMYESIVEVLYIVSGNIDIILDARETLYEGDIILITRNVNENIDRVNILNNSDKSSKFIRSTIYFN